MKSYLTLLSLLFSIRLVTAQKPLKTQFLVIGTTAAGIGASIQAAKAGIKTIIIDSTMILGTDVDEIGSTFTLGLNGRYIKELKTGKTRQEILKQWLEEHNGLKLLLGVKVLSASKARDGWKLKLSDGQRILCGWVFEDKGPPMFEYQPGKFVLDYDISTWEFPGFLARTLVGTPARENWVNAYPLSRFVKTTKENWFVIPSVGKSFSIGQIVGAMAANTIPNSSKDFDVRGVQRILLNEGLYLDSYHDIKPVDRHYLVFQRMCATGIISQRFYMPGGKKVQPEDNLNIKDIIAVFSYYYKDSIVWFDKHPEGSITIAQALELLYQSSHKSFNEIVQLDWNGKLQFTSKYDPERSITRREFAVIMDTYLRPFDIKVDMKGRIK